MAIKAPPPLVGIRAETLAQKAARGDLVTVPDGTTYKGTQLLFNPVTNAATLLLTFTFTDFSAN